MGRLVVFLVAAFSPPTVTAWKKASQAPLPSLVLDPNQAGWMGKVRSIGVCCLAMIVCLAPEPSFILSSQILSHSSVSCDQSGPELLKVNPGRLVCIQDRFLPSSSACLASHTCNYSLSTGREGAKYGSICLLASPLRKSISPGHTFGFSKHSD